MNIRENKQKLKQAIREDNLKLAIVTAKSLGLSMTYICKIADVNVGNLCSFINNKLPVFNEEHKQKVYTVMEDILVYGI